VTVKLLSESLTEADVYYIKLLQCCFYSYPQLYTDNFNKYQLEIKKPLFNSIKAVFTRYYSIYKLVSQRSYPDVQNHKFWLKLAKKIQNNYDQHACFYFFVFCFGFFL